MLIQIYFEHQGPFKGDMLQAYKELAQDIAQEAGLIWKIWTENSETAEAGGVYLFESKAYAEQYLQKHTARLKSFGVKNIRSRMFNINHELSNITKWQAG